MEQDNICKTKRFEFFKQEKVIKTNIYTYLLGRIILTVLVGFIMLVFSQTLISSPNNGCKIKQK